MSKLLRKSEVKDGKGSSEVVETFGDQVKLQSHIKTADWNHYHIIAKGNRLIHKINGQLMSEVVDLGEKDSRKNGILALQLHAGPPMKVQFKNICIKKISGKK